jgi:hypothetical protein
VIAPALATVRVVRLTPVIPPIAAPLVFVTLPPANSCTPSVEVLPALILYLVRYSAK